MQTQKGCPLPESRTVASRLSAVSRNFPKDWRPWLVPVIAPRFRQHAFFHAPTAGFYDWSLKALVEVACVCHIICDVHSSGCCGGSKRWIAKNTECAIRRRSVRRFTRLDGHRSLRVSPADFPRLIIARLTRCVEACFRLSPKSKPLVQR